MSENVIESAKPEDYKDIFDLFLEIHDTLVECNPKKFKKLEGEERENWFPKEVFDYCLDPNSHRFIDVYKIDGKIVGFVDYVVLEDSPYPGINTWKGIFIGNIAIKKEYRRQGIGTELIHYIRDVKCPENNVTEIGLEMEAKNINALNFYKKLGMVESRIKFSMSL